MNKQKYLINIDVNHVEKRPKPSKHYVYCIWITWSNLSKYKIYRRYSQFYELQGQLVNRFKKSNELPILPPKIYIGRSHVFKVAMERKYLIDYYCNKLISLDPEISKCDLILDFFSLNQEDLDFLTQKKSSLDLDKISNPIENKKYKCVHGFKSVTKSELSLRKDEIVDVHMKNADGWWFVSSEYGKGFVPRVVLEAIDDLDKEEDGKSYAVDFFDVFIVKKDYEAINEDEVNLVKGNFVKVLEKRLDGWWKIESEGKIGLSPAIFISKVSIANEEKQIFFPMGSVSSLSFIASNSSFESLNYEEYSFKDSNEPGNELEKIEPSKNLFQNDEKINSKVLVNNQILDVKNLKF
ncbi:SH3 and PX domain-containing 2B [Brachionus plicatilis]|uniref:SH3 and PX domain-containing 2B n=1 Tax=Brachionus plicatilis TaxID=10195 RepID=A0A3M7RCH4_BRAPC|nr:SH3 and PX domain-containing 2B [Brachionus plicatilis]